MNNPVPEVTIKDLWKYNHSMLFVLPLFSDIKMKTSTAPHINYPLIQACLDYGLRNTYLSYPNHDDKFRGKKFLHLLFDATEVQKNNNLTNLDYYSFSDVLIDSKYFNSVKLFEDINRVLFSLEIPSNYSSDIDLLINGKYSKTSNNYKSTVRLTQTDIPKTTNDHGVFIAMNNIPYSIVTRAQFLRKEMEIATRVDIPKDSLEYYSTFQINREVYTYIE